MRMNLKKVMAGAAGVAVAATLAPVLTATTAGAVGVNEGPATLSANGGDSTTDFSLSLPAGAACNEDSAAGGWTVTSFMVPTGTDIANLPQFDPGIGPAPSSFGDYATFKQPLWQPGGNAYVSRATVNASPPEVTGPILQPNTFDFDPGYAAGDIPAGAYDIGIACVDETFMIQQYWSTSITVATNAADPGSTGISWSVPAPPAAPAAPAISTVTPGDSQLSVAFGAVTATPAVTGYTATATPQGGGTPVTATGTAGPLTITGLTNGTTYDVTVTATNTEGTSPASAVVTGTPSVVYAAPVVTASPGTGVGTVDVSWTPAGGTPTAYDVTISPAPTTGSATQTVAATGPLTASFSDLGGGTHTVTVTPTGYPAGESAPAGTDTAIVDSGDGTPATLTQTIQVSREQVNAIVFVQDCDNDLSAGTDGALPYATDDCIVDLGTATLDPTGSFYEAGGELYPIKVIDYRDTDKGWKITGQVDPEFEDSTGTKTFDADALGWEPKEVSQSGALPNGYTMTVDEGPVVAPWSGGTLKAGSILATTTAAGGVQRGIGQAVYSADLTIQIPVSVASGDYAADITFTLVNLT